MPVLAAVCSWFDQLQACFCMPRPAFCCHTEIVPQTPANENENEKLVSRFMSLCFKANLITLL